ncbi:LlsX family protein [Levilactobacillus angrenensis]|uniref:LlsX family protein n=1 Tax=Levilactobacillus angrenensis TaxID=2486020 RepID=A0ABW1U794_9LACO|nr:LlsX family protein [Levilactobacillus angrenensis]
MVKANLRRWSLEGLISLVVTAGLLTIIISSANAWVQMGRASVMDLRVFGLAFYQLTRTTGQANGQTLNQGMGLVWLGGSLLLFALLELRHRLIP